MVLSSLTPKAIGATGERTTLLNFFFSNKNNKNYSWGFFCVHFMFFPSQWRKSKLVEEWTPVMVPMSGTHLFSLVIAACSCYALFACGIAPKTLIPDVPDIQISLKPGLLGCCGDRPARLHRHRVCALAAAGAISADSRHVAVHRGGNDCITPTPLPKPRDSTSGCGRRESRATQPMRLCGRPRCQVVLAQCRESTSAVETILDRLRAHGCNVTLTAYCKCGATDSAGNPLALADGEPLCAMQLPNVGREGHTYLHHLQQRRNSLAPLTLFVNGGVASKHWLQRDVARMLRRFPRAFADGLRYMDSDGFRALGAGRTRARSRHGRLPAHGAAWRQRPVGAGAEEAAALAVAHLEEACAAPARQGAKGQPPRRPCCGACGAVRCCHGFNDVCIGQEYLFEQQTNCSWRGSTADNYAPAAAYESQLAPVAPPNLLVWAAAAWDKAPQVRMRCNDCAGFSVRMIALRLRLQRRQEGSTC